MNYIYIFLLAALPAGWANAQLLNGGFEEWSALPSFEVPVPESQVFANSNQLTYWFWDEQLSVFQVPGAGGIGSAMRVETTAYQGQTEPGFAVWGNPPQSDELIFTDGFAYSGTIPTAINCDLRYNVSFASPGFCVVQFKAAGELVGEGSLGPGTYAFPILGMQPTWTNTTFTFNPPLDVAPDEAIIAFVSNNVFDEEAIGVVGNFIEVDNLTFVGSDALIPGGDFEEWFEASSFELPDGWIVSEFVQANLFEKTNEANSGDFAIKLNTLEFDQVVESYLFQGESTPNGLLPNIPLESGFVGMSFNYKYLPAGLDTAFVVIVMSEVENPEPEDLYFFGDLLGPEDDYTSFTLDVSWLQEFASINYLGVAFISSWNNAENGGNVPLAGSALYLDDVALIYVTDPCDIYVSINFGESLMLCPDGVEILAVDEGFDSYQWYRQMMFGGDVELLEGETSHTLEVDAFEFSVFNVWCVVTFNECVVSSTTIAIDSWVFSPTVIASTVTQICEGESTELQALGTQGTVVWCLNGTPMPGENSNVLTVTAPGTYLASIFPSDCPDIELSSGIGVTITVFTAPTPELVWEDEGFSVTGGNFVSYEWFFNDEPVPDVTGDFIPWQSLSGGLYLVVVTDINGCQASVYEVLFSVEETNSESVNAFPNPADEWLQVTGLTGEYIIFDLAGRMVVRSSVWNDPAVISVGHLKPGVYMLHGAEGSIRFMKQ